MMQGRKITFRVQGAVGHVEGKELSNAQLTVHTMRFSYMYNI